MDSKDTKTININQEQSDEKHSRGFITIVISTFSSVFLAELGDKTQIATLILSAQSGKPLVVFIGASLALVCTSLIGVLLGRWIANTLPRKRFTLMAGALMITLGIWLGIQAIQGFSNV